MKQKSKMRNGISFIVLVITIIIIIVLSTTIIINISYSNPINESNVAKYESDRDSMQSLLTLTVSNLTAQKKGNIILKSGEIIDGKIEYYVDNGLDDNYTVGYIIFKKEKNNENSLYIGKELPIYKAGDTHWYVDKRGKLSLKVGEKEIGNLPPPTPPTISRTDNFVGNYADIEGDGIVDGIIFADLAIGVENGCITGQTDIWGDYQIPKIDNLKDYYISKESYNLEGTKFGNHLVISPINDSMGRERFYILALEDINMKNDARYWFEGKHGLEKNNTKWEFGTGRKNTEYVMGIWKNDKNPNKFISDIWSYFQEEYKKGWFLPSKQEISAAVEELGITKDNFTEYGLNRYYWSSSICYGSQVWHLRLYNDGGMSNGLYMDRARCNVRLINTF